MTKHRKNRRTRKSQRGGAWYDAINPFGSSESSSPPTIEEPGMISNLSSSVTGAVSGAEGFLQGAKEKSTSWFSGFKNPFSSEEVVETQTTVYNPEQSEQSLTMGGKRRRKSRKMKGGKGGLGLTYYATDVSNEGLKVVEPTYWIKGGSKYHRRRHNSRRRTHRKK